MPDSSGESTQVSSDASALIEPDKKQKKRMGIVPKILITLGIVVVGLFLLFTVMNPSPESESEDMFSSESPSSEPGNMDHSSGSSTEEGNSVDEPQTDNSEYEALQREINNPTTYLSVRSSVDFRLIQRDVIDITIVNNAQFATYNNIVLTVDFYNDGSFNGSETITLSESISPGYSESWNKKIEAPSGSDGAEISVYSADGY
jgi:hypothetical protein